MPETVKNDLCQQSEIGRSLYETFLKDRFIWTKVNCWSMMKKRKLLMWKDSGKILKATYTGIVVESQEEGHLFARLMVVRKSTPKADLKSAIGQYEFSMVPRSLFAPDGTMLHCSTRSSLMAILENLSGESHQRTNAAPWTSVDDRWMWMRSVPRNCDIKDYSCTGMTCYRLWKQLP